MAQILNVGMPQDLDLVSGWSIRFTAVDSTGALVNNVKVSNLAIIADAPLGNVEEFEFGPFFLVPGPGA